MSYNHPLTITIEQQHRIFSGAALIAEEETTEAYYDTEAYHLTGSNKWLRQTVDGFDLRVPVARSTPESSHNDTYVELRSEADIRTLLRLADAGSLEPDLLDAGFSAFCVARIVKRTFAKEGVVIDVHSAMYDDTKFTYSVASAATDSTDRLSEASLTPSHKPQLEQSEYRRNLVVGGVGLRLARAYLKNERPEHYEHLVSRHVVKLL